MKTRLVFGFLLSFLLSLPSHAQESAKPANAHSGRIQNIAPQEMWKRVTQCVFPTYPPQAFSAHITGTVDLGLGVSPVGDVDNYRVLRSDHPLLIQPALDAIRQWKFRPNLVQGEVTWSRIRALARFNADGTTAIELEHAILADNFGDPGTSTSASAASAVSTSEAVPRPESAPACQKNAPAHEPRSVCGTSPRDDNPMRVVDQTVTRGLLIHKVQPEYPEAVRKAHIEGTVVLCAVIGKDGKLVNLQAVSGPKELIDPAMKAVQQWVYKPYLLDGEPIDVETEIRVNFGLTNR